MNSPIRRRFSSGSATPRGAEAIGRVDVHERHVEVPAERLDDLNRLVLPQQAVVDEHACQLVSHRTVHEQCRDRGVDTAREPAQHALVAHLRTDALDLLVDDRAAVQTGAAPATR